MSQEKQGRNARIFALSKKGGGTLSYRDLVKEYNFKSVKTVYRIVNREAGRKRKR